MNAEQYANIMTAIAMNATDWEYAQLEHAMRRFRVDEAKKCTPWGCEPNYCECGKMEAEE